MLFQKLERFKLCNLYVIKMSGKLLSIFSMSGFFLRHAYICVSERFLSRTWQLSVWHVTVFAYSKWIRAFRQSIWNFKIKIYQVNHCYLALKSTCNWHCHMHIVAVMQVRAEGVDTWLRLIHVVYKALNRVHS